MPRIDGQLKGAQFEEIASTNPTPAARSRFYSDITNPTSAVPKFYTGTAWLPLRMGQSSALFDNGNSGKSKTIDWNNGLIQKVTLTAGCVFTFANWRLGEVHQLVVTQEMLENIFVNPIPWPYTFNLPTQSVRRTPWQPVGVLWSKAPGVHSWYASGDTGEVYAGWQGGYGPGTTPGAALFGISMTKSPDNTTPGVPAFFYTGRAGTPFIDYWRSIDSGNKFYISQNNPEGSTAGPGTINMTDVHPTGKFVFFASSTTPFVGMRYVLENGNPSLAYANPGTLPTGAGNGVAVSPSGSFVAVAHATSPFLSVYPVKPAGFGPKVGNPGTLPAGQGISVAWNPLGDFLAVQHDTTPFLSVYPFDAFTGAIGTKVANPSLLPPGSASIGGHTVAWRPQGDWIAMATSSSPFIWTAPFNRTTGTFGTPIDWTTIPPFGPPGAAPASASRCVAWSPCGMFLIVGFASQFQIYRWTDAGPNLVDTPVFADGSAPGAQVNDIVWHPHGDLFTVVLNASPWLLTYNAPRNTRSQIKLLQ